MNCAELRDLLRDDAGASSPGASAHLEAGASSHLEAGASAHLEECPACRDLAADHGRLAHALDSGAAVGAAVGLDFDAMTRLLVHERGAAPRLLDRPSPVRLGIATAAVLVVAVAVLLIRPRPDLDLYPTLRLAIELAPLIALAFVAAAISLQPLHQRQAPRAAVAMALGLALFLPFALAAVPPVHTGHPASAAGAGPDLIPRALACFGFGILLGLPIFITLRLLDRGGHRGLSRALTAAAAAGAGAQVALALHCPIPQPLHLLAGHAPLAAGFVAAAALAWLARDVSRAARKH